jgi:hypothetical protein
MTEPDKAGKMGISVDDGTGHHKDYKLDFDKQADGAKADHQPGEFGPQGSKDGAPGADGAYQPGPDGKIHIQDGNLKITAEQPQGPTGPTVVTVDDGKGEPTKYTLDEQDQDKAGLKTEDIKTPEAKQTDPQATPAGDNRSQSQAAGEHHGGAVGAVGANGSGDATLSGVHTMPAAAGFSTPGGLDLHGDFAPAAGHDGASGGDAASAGDSTGDSGTVGAGSEKTQLASAGGDFFSGGVSGDVSGAIGGLDDTASLQAAAHTGSDPSGAIGGLGDTASLQAAAHTGSDDSPAPPDNGLGAAPGGMDPNAVQHPAGAGAAGAGGMGSMGGMMGGMGGMGGGGGDQQRSSQYRVDGAIFETSGAGGRISGSLDDEGDRSIRYDR